MAPGARFFGGAYVLELFVVDVCRCPRGVTRAARQGRGTAGAAEPHTDQVADTVWPGWPEHRHGGDGKGQRYVLRCLGGVLDATRCLEMFVRKRNSRSLLPAYSRRRKAACVSRGRALAGQRRAPHADTAVTQ